MLPARVNRAVLTMRELWESFQVTTAPGEGTEASWRAQPPAEAEEVQRSVLQSVVALPRHTLAAGSDSGAIQIHTVDGDIVRLTHILQACSCASLKPPQTPEAGAAPWMMKKVQA